MATLRRGAATPAATESAIQNIAEVAAYVDSHITKGKTINLMKKAGKDASSHLAQAMKILRDASDKFNAMD